MASSLALDRLHAARDEFDTNRVKFFIGGVMAVPVSVVLQEKLGSIWIPILLLFGAVCATLISTVLESALKPLGWKSSFYDAGVSVQCFAYGGAIPLFVGLMIPSHGLRIIVEMVITVLLSGMALKHWQSKETKERKTKIPLWLIAFFIFASVGILVGLSHLAAMK